MTNLTITLEENLKKKVISKAKKSGVTVSLLIRQFFQNYVDGEYEVKLLQKNDILKAHERLVSDLENGKSEKYKSGKQVVDSII